MVKSVQQVTGGQKRALIWLLLWKEAVSPAFQVQKGQKMGLRDGSSFQEGCHGFESRLPMRANFISMKNETFHGRKSGLVAQWQSGRLITGWSQVRILPGPFRSKADENPVQSTNFTW
jgi:hypothetical protein